MQTGERFVVIILFLIFFLLNWGKEESMQYFFLKSNLFPFPHTCTTKEQHHANLTCGLLPFHRHNLCSHPDTKLQSKKTQSGHRTACYCSLLPYVRLWGQVSPLIKQKLTLLLCMSGITHLPIQQEQLFNFWKILDLEFITVVHFHTFGQKTNA